MNKLEQLDLELDMILEEIEEINSEIYENKIAIERIESQLNDFE
jgi:hypothetical protein